MRICASAAALRPFIFISFVRTPCHGCRSNPQTKYSLSLSLCAVHPWLSSEILVTMVAIPPMAICVRQLPLFPLFPFLHFQFPPPYVIWLRSLLRSPVAQPTTHNPQSTSHIPLSICLTPHPTCHRSGPLESQRVHQIEATTTTITIDQCSVTPTPFSHCPRIPLPNRFMYTSICIYMSVCACL